MSNIYKFPQVTLLGYAKTNELMYAPSKSRKLKFNNTQANSIELGQLPLNQNL